MPRTVRLGLYQGVGDRRHLNMVFFIPCFAYDWMSRRKLHPANIVGLALILLDLTLQPIVLSWGTWTDFANAIQQFVA
jgi:hypothetical protein